MPVRPSVWRKGVRNALNVGKIDALWLPEDRKESDQCNLSSSPGPAAPGPILLCWGRKLLAPYPADEKTAYSPLTGSLTN